MEATTIVPTGDGWTTDSISAGVGSGVVPDMSTRQGGLVLAAPLPLVTKRELAAHYRVSTRWVELQMSKGMPSRKVGGARRYELGIVDRWLRATYGD